MKPFFAAVPVFALALCYRAPGSNVPAPDVDRSPTDLAVAANGKWAITANNGASTASLINLETGAVVMEVPVGQKPFALALTPDNKRVVVSNSWGNSVSLLDVGASTLTPVHTFSVGEEPRGVAVTRDGTRAFVALAGEGAVAVVDVAAGKVVAKWSVGQEPWHLTLNADGTRLAVGNSRERTVTVLDTQTGKPAHTVRTLGRNLRHMAVSPDGKWAYVPAIAERGMGVTKSNIDRGWIVGNRLVRIPLTQAGLREAITLDISGKAVGDVDGVSFSPDGKTLALTAGGTHELLLFRLDGLPFASYGGPSDHMDFALQNDAARFRRVPLGGRPLGAQFSPDGKQILVANYLTNSVQSVDATTGQITRTIALGGPTMPSLARRGEAIFYDANRSFGSWYSCGTCHTEGHTNGGMFDTLNDGGIGKPKKTLSLRGVAQTAPYTWHGWQTSLAGGIRESMVKSMQGPEPTDEDVKAVQAFLQTLGFRPSPYRLAGGGLTEAAKRGRVVFGAKNCVSCHNGPDFAGTSVVLAGLEAPDDVYKGFNPPPLRGVYNRAPFLHDGRADTLEEVLTEYHRPSQLTGKPDCTPTELADLVAYLKSL